MEQREHQRDEDHVSVLWRVGISVAYTLASIPVLVWLAHLLNRITGWRLTAALEQFSGRLLDIDMWIVLFISFVLCLFLLLFGEKLPSGKVIRWKSRTLLWIVRAECAFIVLLVAFGAVFSIVNGHPPNLSRLFAGQ